MIIRNISKIIAQGTTGDISITVNNKNYTGTIDENGVARITVDVLPVGEYDIAANYGGDKNYTNASAKLVKGLNVTKVDDYVMNVTAVDVKVGENTTITVNVPKDATGNVTIWVNGTTAINTTIVNGVATFNITKDIEGKYTVNATLSDPKYANKTVETVYYVTRNDTPMNITVLNDTLIYVGDVVKVVVSVPSDATGTVTIGVNGKKYTNYVEDGKAVFEISGLKKGDYNVEASYSGDKKYEANNTITDIIVTFHDDDNGNHAGNGGSQDSANGVNLADHPTGNPIFALLLILVVLTSTQIRRFKK
ncbi:Ig-like domain-containing protein [uncultured Methanobrevibacter sp.]|uniref:Ig-like domain-containing protein n=1 Tax=uncultured Methanobrevibacter sp. TaxID=253161 RepID=UPI0026224658|nr:Ig-like domain-containing protein [uncultured Methanobrevibacter sp.]